MSDKRICFDFEVDFSNGGGIQGQGFRLDIEGDDISDEALSAYIIADLRLLMVGEVRILNKRVIEEAHKRGEVSSAASAPRVRLVDLSHTIEDGMVTYKGIPAPHICDHMSHAQSAGLYEGGTEFHFGRIDMVSNTGTYIDTPFHRFRDGEDLAAVEVGRVSGLPGVVVRVEGMTGRAIDWMSFAATDITGHAVLVETGWSRHWRTEQYYEGHPYLTEAAAAYLRERGAALVGIDSLNIDNTSGGTRPVHTTLLGAGIPIVEHMTNLQALPPEGFSFFAAPPKVKGMGTFPVRAHAVITSEAPPAI